jgi:hypothetical protein
MGDTWPRPPRRNEHGEHESENVEHAGSVSNLEALQAGYHRLRVLLR